MGVHGKQTLGGKPEGAPCLEQEHAGGIQEVSPGPRGGLEIQVADHGLDGTD